MKYEYQMVQIPPNITINTKNQRGNEAATYLQRIIDGHADEGWEFYRVDQVGVHSKPGCLAGLFGAREQTTYYNVVSFRRPAKT